LGAWRSNRVTRMSPRFVWSVAVVVMGQPAVQEG
jgi:hypothetical protein